MLVLAAGCGRTPQVLDDESVARELDAMYTAVTSQRSDLLQASRERLLILHSEHRLSDTGLAEIDRLAAKGGDGKWREAAEGLYAFIRNQRKTRH